MKYLIYLLSISLFLLTSSVFACTCFGTAGEIAPPDEIKLTIINCNQTCNTAVTVVNDINFYIPGRTTDGKSIIFPAAVIVDHNPTDAAALVQEKFHSAQGTYKVITFKQLLADNNSNQTVNVTQISDKADDAYLQNQTEIFQKALSVYQSYMKAPKFLTNTIFYVGFFTMIAFFAIFIANTIYIYFRNHLLPTATVNTLLSNTLDKQLLPYLLLYLVIQTFIPSGIMSLELSAEIFTAGYYWFSLAYIIYTLCCFRFFYNRLFKAASFTDHTWFTRLYLLQRSLFMIVLGWGFAYAGPSINIAFCIIYVLLAVMFSYAHRAGAISLNDQSKRAYLKSQSFSFIVYFIIMPAFFLFLIFAGIFHFNLFTSNLKLMYVVYSLLIVVCLIKYYSILKQVGHNAKKSSVIFVIMSVVLPIVFLNTINSTFNSCNCGGTDYTSKPEFSYLSKYKEYAISHGILVDVPK